MQTPFDILGIPEDSDDGTVKKAYLAKVRSCPPERFPREFERIRRAYELIRDEKARVRYRLFHLERPRPEDIAGLILKKQVRQAEYSSEEIEKGMAAGLETFCRFFRLDAY
ncbi:hypothetical protein GF1_21360 [Desulfolithobacter dissulfuricans]|uniref:J domain-containing protein n=1 Tax=Desulfolithobacter dissulfuricans TaxID=2795293 RepID=A0A915XJ02_9BACT|nr:J domain-containing protein [Desulfolithobacter dissulfuricans]BCO09760.1 hypothetical protein GF1_21360 [Desulfolithobacter dissulfuricans]